MNLLDEIAARTRLRVAEQKKRRPPEQVMREAEALGAAAGFPFERALRGGDIAFICEIKRASPSKGLIAADFRPADIASEYAEAGAEALSVLTEPFFFGGGDGFLRAAADCVAVPLLRKDFVVDPVMLYEARLLGASAVLLIAALLSPRELAEYTALAHALGLSALIEARDEAEIDAALAAGARMIGVNNRDLRTFEVDFSRSERLRGRVPDSVLFVAESGVTGPGDIAALRAAGADAVLIGEALMRSADRGAEIRRLRGVRP